MIAIDTNLLIYAHREESPWFESADNVITTLAESGANWAIPWPSIHEFLSIVTHPLIFDAPSSREQAFEQIETWLEAPTLFLLSETADHWSRLKTMLTEGKITGPKTHDAKTQKVPAPNGPGDEGSRKDKPISQKPPAPPVSPPQTRTPKR